MTTAAHTPGEWRFTFRGVDQDANWASRIPYAIERSVGNAVLPIADVCDQPQAEANARLIAAAPELLAALASMVARIEYYSAHDGERPNIEQWEYTEGSSDMATARAAIAKATGSAA